MQKCTTNSTCCRCRMRPLWATTVGQPHIIIICTVQFGQATSQLCQWTGTDNRIQLVS